LTFHHLFKEDWTSFCLYCQNRCEFRAGGGYEVGMVAYFIDHYSCSQCQEEFSIHYLYGSEQDPLGFGFTCQDLTCLHHYQSQYIQVALKDAIQHPVKIPAFDYDFADKSALHQRLKILAFFT
jgi:hypothetical protein